MAEMPENPEHSDSAEPRSKIDPAIVIGLVVAVAVLLVAGPLLLPRLVQWGAEPDHSREVTYTIPLGTADTIAAGGDPKVVPAEMIFTLGVQDVLVIHNDDAVPHTFGPYWVAASNTLRIHFSQPAVYEGFCSVHPSRQVRIVVEAG